jgi:hypothetical protein
MMTMSSKRSEPRALIPTEVVSREQSAILAPQNRLSGATEQAMQVVDTALATFDPDEAWHKIQNYRSFIDRLREYALGKTEPRHWTNFEGGPWLRVEGAECVADIGSLSYGMLDAWTEDGEDEGGHYWIRIVKMWFRCGPRYVEAMGSAYSRDNFFSGGGKLSAKDVDRNKIYRKAESRCKRNGICEVFAIRGFTWEDVAKLTGGRVTDDKVSSPNFRRGAKGGGLSNGNSEDFATKPQFAKGVWEEWCKAVDRDKNDKAGGMEEFGDWIKSVLSIQRCKAWDKYTLEECGKLKRAALDKQQGG